MPKLRNLNKTIYNSKKEPYKLSRDEDATVKAVLLQFLTNNIEGGDHMESVRAGLLAQRIIDTNKEEININPETFKALERRMEKNKVLVNDKKIDFMQNDHILTMAKAYSGIIDEDDFTIEEGEKAKPIVKKG